ncbi:MAG: xanthine dehydrogenase family protein subunit M [Gemmatimonadota bacterium]|nr:MAG: xanthine dehydrogenase family protein subunit M [Gemmatimonadota bacterium]
MKPASFEYRRPETVEEVIHLLAEYGDEAKLLAGGQSLIPTMNFRLAQPAVLIDLNRVEGLDGLAEVDDGGLLLGAMVRQASAEKSALVVERAPLMAETLPFVAHSQIRNRGTIGGNLAHADPRSELPAVMLALGATLRVRGLDGDRSIGAGDFFSGFFGTALEEGELLSEVLLPPAPERGGQAFLEVSRRRGDYAMVGVAVSVACDAAGQCRLARIALLSVGSRPTLAERASACLVGERPSSAAVLAAGHAAGTQDIDPPADMHASVAYRRHLATVLVRRALGTAFERAGCIVGDGDS